jgi:hypothetical protein
LDTKRTWTVATVGPPKDRLNIYPAELLCEILTSNQGFVWLTLSIRTPLSRPLHKNRRGERKAFDASQKRRKQRITGKEERY